ncbi:integrase, catalytic region, zinc finger, CCHC-type containing protein [Tanacetum coccineum]
MMLLARAITQRYSTPTNNRLHTSSNTRNQAVIQDGRMDIQSKNVGYAGNESTPGKTNVQCYNCNGKCHYARECQKPKVRDAKYFREQMLLATKDEAGVHLDEEENDFMLDNACVDNALEELNATVIMMVRIQPTDDKSYAEPTYDAELISEVNASQIDIINGLLSKSNHEQRHHKKLETIIHTSGDDQIDYDIIFDDIYGSLVLGMAFSHLDKVWLDSENWSIRRIGIQYGVSDDLAWAPRIKYQNFLELVWIRRIRLPGYGVLSSFGSVYWTSWIRRIELLRYGVLDFLGMAYCAPLAMVLSSSKSLDTAYASRMIWRIDVRINDFLKLFVYASNTAFSSIFFPILDNYRK